MNIIKESDRVPRAKRIHSNIKVYHIVLRGIDRQNIFLDDEDKNKFLRELIKLKKNYSYEIYAYCLMNNHVHIAIYDKENNISKIMQSIGIRYSLYFNKKYDRVGHLFQNRFLSKTIETREYFLILCRYIHRNPKDMGIYDFIKYKWSSYQEYLKESKIINSKKLLSFFSENLEEAKKEFINFHKIHIEGKEIYEKVEYEFEIIKDEEIAKYICKKLKLDNIRDILKYNIKLRNQYISECKKIQGISNRQFSRILGINRKVIDRVI